VERRLKFGKKIEGKRRAHLLFCRVKWNVIPSTSEQPCTLVQATASIIMGVHYILKYANQLLLDRVTPGVVRLAIQMEYKIRMHNYNYEEAQVRR
jgi:hypothetical protein